MYINPRTTKFDKIGPDALLEYDKFCSNFDNYWRSRGGKKDFFNRSLLEIFEDKRVFSCYGKYLSAEFLFRVWETKGIPPWANGR